MPSLKPAARAPSKKTKAPPPKFSVAPKSAEFIGGSDDTDEAPARPSIKKAVSFEDKPAIIGSSKPVAPARTANPVKKALPNGTKSSPTPSSSEAETEDSEDEEAANGKGQSDEEGSEEEDGSPSAAESSSTANSSAPAVRPPSGTPAPKPSYIVQPVSGVKRKAHEVSASKHSNQRQSGSEDEEESSTEDESGSSSDGEEATSAKAITRAAAPQDAQNRRPVKLYQPPSGFETAMISFAPSSKAADLLNPSNLEGKQIWHITAPARLSITSIKEASAQSLQDGSSILTQKGIDYGLIPQTRGADGALLLPHVQENQYQSSQASVASALHIRQLVKLPIFVTRPSAPAQVDSDVPRNQQPANLKMRFRPFGVSSSSDSEPEAVVREQRSVPRAQLRPPPTVEKRSSPKKRKQTEAAASLSTGSSAVKSKKRKPTPEAAISKDISDIDFDSPSAKQTSPKKQKKHKFEKPRKVSPPAAAIVDDSDPMEIAAPVKQNSPEKTVKHKTNGDSTVAQTPNGKETPEQKTKRKEERRRQRTKNSATKLDPATPTAKSGSNPSSAKSKPTAPPLPLAEFSARLSAEEEKKATRQKGDSSQLPTPGQSSPSKESKTEHAKRKKEKKERRAALRAEFEGN